MEPKSVGEILSSKNQVTAEKYRCRLCHQELKPLDIGNGMTITPSICPKCSKAEDAQRIKSNHYNSRLQHVIPKHYWEARLTDLSPALQDLLLNLPDDKGVYLWGPPGTGKTHTLIAYARYLLESGHFVVRTVYDELLNRIKNAFSDPDGGSWNIRCNMKTAEYLIIEDMGTSVSIGSEETDFSVRTILEILDKRIESNLPTFFSSNKSLDEIGMSFDERVKSRIGGCCEIIKCTGTDRRLAITREE